MLKRFSVDDVQFRLILQLHTYMEKLHERGCRGGKHCPNHTPLVLTRGNPERCRIAGRLSATQEVYYRISEAAGRKPGGFFIKKSSRKNREDKIFEGLNYSWPFFSLMAA